MRHQRITFSRQHSQNKICLSASPPPAHSPLPVPATVPPLIFFQLHSPPISQPSLAYPPTASQHYALFPKSFANLTLRMTSNTMWFIFQTKNYKKIKNKKQQTKTKVSSGGPYESPCSNVHGLKKRLQYWLLYVGVLLVLGIRRASMMTTWGLLLRTKAQEWRNTAKTLLGSSGYK